MLTALLLAALLSSSSPAIPGAFQTTRADGAIGTWILTDGHFSIAWYQKSPAKFIATEGGSWSYGDHGLLRLRYEYDTANPDRVGTMRVIGPPPAASSFQSDGLTWTRLDDGGPGELEGAWLMTGRKRDGEISTRRPGARRTMKILSGTRFQWIAYNVETKEFFGSGGGTYTTKDGAYTETIEFFSRDDSRAGASLGFRYSLPEGVWHHEGKSTKGDPMYEIWEPRTKLGI